MLIMKADLSKPWDWAESHFLETWKFGSRFQKLQCITVLGQAEEDFVLPLLVVDCLS